MAQRPTVDDLRTHIGLPEAPFGSDVLALLQESLDASLELVESRVTLPVGATSNDYPAPVRMAVLLTAHRLWKRRTSPEGVAGFGDLGAIRITAVDADVEALISPYLRLDGFA